ncbi:questin oxidase family protein [Streptomyces sp. ODS28]|uniref:questin oxidase family protein n=1 Tax=Streptomyces sp. ODS28 TaxID=3136688 RepID=UPI0031EDF50F
MTSDGTLDNGTLDEALDRLHFTGPEREGWLSNHAPMAVEALARHGQAHTVHRWIDGYRDKLEDMPSPVAPVHDDNWQEALGDHRRLADWIVYFGRQLGARPWQDVLVQWWPRLLPGIVAAATHPVIRVGHCVRGLLEGEVTGPRIAELAHALGYWAARHQFLTGIGKLPYEGAPRTAGEALDAVPLVAPYGSDLGIRQRLPLITALPPRPGGDGLGPEEARAGLEALVRAATLRYATHGHGSPVMLVHAATGPNAVLRVLPALPRELWLPGFAAAWSASAAITAAYAPREARPLPEAEDPAPEEMFERAAAHGDEHVVKLADTALDIADPVIAHAAIHRATQLIER